MPFPDCLYFLSVLRASAPLRPVFFPYLSWTERLIQSQKEMSHTSAWINRLRGLRRTCAVAEGAAEVLDLGGDAVAEGFDSPA